MDGAFSTFGIAEIFVVEVDMTMDDNGILFSTEKNNKNWLIQALKLALVFFYKLLFRLFFLKSQTMYCLWPINLYSFSMLFGQNEPYNFFFSELSFQTLSIHQTCRHFYYTPI